MGQSRSPWHSHAAFGHKPPPYDKSLWTRNKHKLPVICALCVTSSESQEAYQFVSLRECSSKSGQCAYQKPAHKSTILGERLHMHDNTRTRPTSTIRSIASSSTTTDNWIYWAGVYQSVNTKPPEWASHCLGLPCNDRSVRRLPLCHCTVHNICIATSQG